MLDFNTSIGFEEEKTFCKNPTLNEDETKHFFHLNTPVNKLETNRWQFPLKFVSFFCETINMHHVIFTQFPQWLNLLDCIR